jgi:DNA-binding NtrC family response regulator
METLMQADKLERKPQILLADDNTDLRELLALVLKKAGFGVTVCYNGQHLLEWLERKEYFDLIISDVRMPALTGLEVLESQFGDPAFPPFICMTAFGDRQTHEAAHRFGAVATLDKPFDIDDMVELAKSTCLKRHHTKNLDD